MDDKGLVNAVLGKLFNESCLSNDNIPKEISICGGSDFIRGEVVNRVAKKYNDCRVKEGSEGYSINLDYFIDVCQREYQEAQKRSQSFSR